MGHGRFVSIADRLVDISEDRNFFQNLECVEVHLKHRGLTVALVGTVVE